MEIKGRYLDHLRQSVQPALSNHVYTSIFITSLILHLQELRLNRTPGLGVVPPCSRLLLCIFRF